MKLSPGRSKCHQLMLASAAALASTLAPTSVFANDEKSTAAINIDAAGVALQGYDAVSHFSGSTQKKGNIATADKSDSSSRTRYQRGCDPVRSMLIAGWASSKGSGMPHQRRAGALVFASVDRAQELLEHGDEVGRCLQHRVMSAAFDGLDR